MDMQRRKRGVALLSVVSNSALVGLKIVVGLLTGSVSVLSEAIHSGIDLLAAVIAWFAVRTSAKPADPEHPFGHEKIENVSGVIEAVLIFVAAAWIIYEAIHKILRPAPLERLGWGCGVMLVSVVMNYIVSKMLFRVGQESESMALQADAWHLRTDVWTSAGVMGALGFITVGERLSPGANLQWLDPCAAVGVAVLILRAAFHLTVQSGRDLLDVSLPGEENEWLREYLGGLKSSGYEFHRLRTRKAGATRFVEFHLLVNPALSVEDSHRITEEVTARIRSRLAGAHVTVHIEPYEDSDLSPAAAAEKLDFEEETE